MKISLHAHWLSLILTLIVLCCSFSGCISPWKMRQIKRLPPAEPLTRLVTAHRSNIHNGLPDNSIPAIKEAIRAGISNLEIDVRRAANGDLFLFHDGSLNSSNSFAPAHLHGKPIQELTSEERRSVSLDKEGTIRIPSFAEALAAIKGSSSRLQVDMKGESDELADAVIRQAIASGLTDQVIIQFRSIERLQRALEKHPTLHTLARCKSEVDVKAALNVGAEIIELEGWASADAIAETHGEHARVMVNVAHPFFDTFENWELLRSKGIDIIMTDHAVCVDREPEVAPQICADL